MSRFAIPRRSVLAGGLGLIALLAVSFFAIPSGPPAKLLWRATGAEHALMLTRSAAHHSHPAVGLSDHDVPMAAVPEPGVIASLIGGVALLLSLRRRG